MLRTKTSSAAHLPTPFVKHYMRRDDNVLPLVVAVATAPIVLADGVLRAPDGLDREHGIQFVIPDELRAIIPKAEDCTEATVREAWEFLCNEWLVDVAADHVGKAIIIADALTMIERSLLPERPCFFITAGQRGNGKTTLFIMLVMAVTGVRPAAAAWSFDENERRKALLAYLMAGVPYILWDNIPRGTQISCPHIERSCTTASYTDRKLGVSETVITAAATINHFTGNNIGAKGDLASRSLQVRLNVDRVDPENRDFMHPDPVGWTQNHRGEILRAGQELDFKDLFIRQEEDDEASASLDDALEIMMKKWPKGCAPLALVKMINSEAEGAQTVRDFLVAGQDRFISEKSVGWLLKPYVDTVTPSGHVLRKHKDTDTNTVIYRVERLKRS